MQLNKDDQMIDDMIVGYLKGSLTASQTNELVAWIKQNQSNKRYFDEYCEIWIISNAIHENSKYDYRKGFLHFKEQVAKNKQKIGLLPLQNFNLLKKVAAVFIVSFSLGGVLFFNIGRKHGDLSKLLYNEIIVPRGAHAQFVLTDGTKVTLNAESRLRYHNRYGVSNREVELEGEGYFEVAKDKNKPFIVRTSHINIEALGTEFNVKAYPSDKTIETTLVQGSVKIEDKTNAEDQGSVILKPNQKLTYYKDNKTEKEEQLDRTAHNKQDAAQTTEKMQKGLPGRIAENIDVLPSISWKENRWVIERQNLSKLALDIERKFDIHIRFGSERLKNFRFTGTLFDESLEQVLQVMSFSAPINYKIKGKDVVFTEKENFEKIYQKLYKDKSK